MIAAQISLLLLVSGLTEGYLWTAKRKPWEECLDVAIVGGGISGMYTGWRLRNRGWNIGIYENTDRIGGRMFSVTLPSVPNVPAELGAMRYEPGVHTMLESLIPALGLRSDVFQQGQFEKMYYLRGKRLYARDLDSPTLPYNLAPGESKNASLLRWYLSQRALNVTEPDHIPDIEEAVTPDGVPVYKQGYINLMDTVWSNEAKEYLKTSGAFDDFYNPVVNAVYYVVASNPTTPRVNRRTIVSGLNEVPKRLAAQFLEASSRHQITLNRRVESVRKAWSAGQFVYELTVSETQTAEGYTSVKKQVRAHKVCASHVILALPPRALKNIRWYPLQRDPAIREALDAVHDVSAMKIFLAYPNPWWDNLAVSSKSFVTDLPLRQGGEFGRFRNASGHETALMMINYADGKLNTDFWKNPSSFEGTVSSSAVPAALSVSTTVVEHVHHHLATMYDVTPSAIPRPLDGVMHIWDDVQSGGAWHFLKPGFKPKTVATLVQRPSHSDRVFVVTNSFSLRFYGWAEGCLRAADDVLSKFFSSSA